MPSPDEWLTHLQADAIVAFFGYSESFRGTAGLASFRTELGDFIKHTRAQRYNTTSAPQLVLVSPIAFENLSSVHGTPDGVVENANLALYTAAMEKVALEHQLPFVNLFAPSQRWYDSNEEPLTRDGCNLTEAGYALLAPLLADVLFGGSESLPDPALLAAVREKIWMWHYYYKIPNGVHVYGRRHRPFGPVNYPGELRKLAQMTATHCSAIDTKPVGDGDRSLGADVFHRHFRSEHPLAAPGIGGRAVWIVRFESAQPHREQASILLAPTMNTTCWRDCGFLGDWIRPAYETAKSLLAGEALAAATWTPPTTTLQGRDKELFLKGAEIYRREGHCITCHQDDGKGLPAAQLPPLAGTRWVQGDEERLIKLTLHGLMGPIEMKGEAYGGLVPMTAFEGLSDEEIAAALTYVRQSFGNQASVISPARVKAVRAATAGQEGFLNPADLLKAHPHAAR